MKITVRSAHGSGGTELADLESEANVAEENAVLGRTKDYALRKEAWESVRARIAKVHGTCMHTTCCTQVAFQHSVLDTLRMLMRITCKALQMAFSCVESGHAGMCAQQTCFGLQYESGYFLSRARCAVLLGWSIACLPCT